MSIADKLLEGTTEQGQAPFRDAQTDTSSTGGEGDTTGTGGERDADKEPEPNPYASHFDDAVLTTGQLAEMDIPKKAKLLGDFFEDGDLGFVYAPRGLGKTWLSMAVADALARGHSLGEWKAGDAATKVLIVDGEMSLSDSKERAQALKLSDGIQWIHHEHLFNETESVLNLTKPDQQDALTTYCQAQAIKCVIFDNLSCLFYGLKENDSDDWGELVLPWLLRMRRLGIAVIIVAHAGRNGLMRGTSKREDQAHWILKLKYAPSSASDAEGAKFISQFTKNRHSPEKRSPSLLWKFIPGDDNRTEIACQVHTGYDAFLQLVEDGVEAAHEIAEELGVFKGTVSKWVKKGVDEGKINKENRTLKWIG